MQEGRETLSYKVQECDAMIDARMAELRKKYEWVIASDSYPCVVCGDAYYTVTLTWGSLD